MIATPAVLDLSATELPATTTGALRSFRHSVPKGRLFELAKHKRWIFVSAATESLFIGGAVVDLGYLSKAFVYVAEKKSGRMIAHTTSLMPPGPWCKVERNEKKQSTSLFRSPALNLRILRTSIGAYALRAKASGLHVDVMLDPRCEPIVASNLLIDSGTGITEKGLSLHARGTVTVKSEMFDISHALGGTDFTDGYLPRHTRWKWANVSGRTDGHIIGVNLVQGFMGESECTISIDREMQRVGEGVFSVPADPLQPWQVRSKCGRVDLAFQPVALHTENLDLRVLHSKFLQPVGIFSGTVQSNDGRTLQVRDMLGVCEDQDVLW